jgi:hypothetical protein
MIKTIRIRLELLSIALPQFDAVGAYANDSFNYS